MIKHYDSILIHYIIIIGGFGIYQKANACKSFSMVTKQMYIQIIYLNMLPIITSSGSSSGSHSSTSNSSSSRGNVSAL